MAKAQVALLLLVVGLGGCASFGGIPCSVGPDQPGEGFEERWLPHEKDYALVINRAGARFCGWKPGNPDSYLPKATAPETAINGP